MQCARTSRKALKSQSTLPTDRTVELGGDLFEIRYGCDVTDVTGVTCLRRLGGEGKPLGIADVHPTRATERHLLTPRAGVESLQ
jgi:hypothetical protein